MAGRLPGSFNSFHPLQSLYEVFCRADTKTPAAASPQASHILQFVAMSSMSLGAPCEAEIADARVILDLDLDVRTSRDGFYWAKWAHGGWLRFCVATEND